MDSRSHQLRVKQRGSSAVLRRLFNQTVLKTPFARAASHVPSRRRRRSDCSVAGAQTVTLSHCPPAPSAIQPAFSVLLLYTPPHAQAQAVADDLEQENGGEENEVSLAATAAAALHALACDACAPPSQQKQYRNTVLKTLSPSLPPSFLQEIRSKLQMLQHLMMQQQQQQQRGDGL